MWEFLLLLVGLFLLVKGADYLVDGSIALANKFHISKMIIGLTVVSLGTSLPELVVNIFASSSNAGEIALGTIIGSNISNILLVLGVATTVSIIKIDRENEFKELTFSAIAGFILFILLIWGQKISGYLSWLQGIILLFFFIVFMFFVLKDLRNPKVIHKKIRKDEFEKKKLKAPLFMILLLGILALYLGGKWTVDGVAAFAETIGISDYIISLVIIAIGTSLPELITSVNAAMKKEADIAFGNIIGSNALNIFLILGISSVLRPLEIPGYALIDVFILLLVSVLLFVVAFNKKNELRNWHGISFILLYVLYVLFLMLR